VQISMDGKGRWIDNVFIERLWRSMKYVLLPIQNRPLSRDLPIQNGPGCLTNLLGLTQRGL